MVATFASSLGAPCSFGDFPNRVSSSGFIYVLRLLAFRCNVAFCHSLSVLRCFGNMYDFDLSSCFCVPMLPFDLRFYFAICLFVDFAQKFGWWLFICFPVSIFCDVAIA